ncbi:MAG: PQQ-binding-like beta-propeller repeat protein, partial [Nocardiopsaceae bacterium]|nr:PQQ-binding-like beta-propeller repeat protein [Nocardiopsaceae bacterium]
MQITGAVLTDRGEPLGGVAVSDGRDWARTGADGSFVLASQAGRPVWARRPPDWPGGRWWGHAQPGEPLLLQLRPARPGEAARSAGPAALTRLAHLTDPHVTVPGDGPAEPAALATRFGDRGDTAAWLRSALAGAAARGAGLAVITGDLTDHGTPAEFRRFTEAVAAAPVPVEIMPGNHDHVGHRYQPEPGDDPCGGGFLGTATVTRYERALGPRWWSADLAGLHLVALDWFSAWCGIDAAEQREFVAADLATRAPGLPVVLLAHDRPDDATLAVARQGAGEPGLLAVLTGHWHADGEVADDGCHFLSTPSVSFGGLDWSRPSWRLVTVSRPDGPPVLRHELAGTAPATQPGRSAAWIPAGSAAPSGGGAVAGTGEAARAAGHRLGERQHLGGVAAGGGAVFAPAAAADGTGLVSRAGPAGVAWTARAAGEPVTGITAAAGQVLAVSGAGRLAALDPATGGQRWAYQLPGRHRRRLLAAPLVSQDGQVIIGDIGAVACLAAATGQVRWELAGPGSPDTLLTYGTGLVSGELAVLPFGGPGAGLTALRVAGGGVAGPDPARTPPPSCSLVPAGDGDAMVVRTATTSLE